MSLSVSCERKCGAPSNRNNSSAAGRKSATLLMGFLTTMAQANGHEDQRLPLIDHMTHTEQLQVLNELAADDLKSMLLSMFQSDNDQASNKVPRPRKPDLRSPLEVQKEKKNKSKYQKALEKQMKKESQKNKSRAPQRNLEPYKNSEDYNQMSAFERSLDENRRQREYLLQEYRDEGRIDEREYPIAKQMADEQALSKKERKRRKKAAKLAKKYGEPTMPQLMEGDALYGPPMLGYPQPFEIPAPITFDPSFVGGEFSDDEYDDEYNDEYDDSNSSNQDENYELEVPRDKWVKDPIKMGEQAELEPTSWDQFDSKYNRPLTDMERTEKELLQAKQEYFEQLKREAEFKKNHPDEANKQPAQPIKKRAEIPKEWEELTPAKRQLKENERHFQELQELKKAAEGEDYKLPVPIKPERQDFKPSDQDADFDKAAEAGDLATDSKAKDDEAKVVEPTTEADNAQLPLEAESVEQPKPLSTQKVPESHENKLCPDCEPQVDDKVDDSEMNPYERALRDNEKHKKRFVEELKQAAEERKQRVKEEREAQEKADKEKREWLEQVYKDTGEMPPELAEMRAEEEKKRQEEEAKKRPEPPTPKSMRERVAEESKKRKDAHMAKLRREGEEEKARKQAERDEETARRREENPDYEPPPPLTVPKGKPTPPPDYKYPKKAREHGFGEPLDPDDNKKENQKEEEKESEREKEIELELEKLEKERLSLLEQEKERQKQIDKEKEIERERQQEVDAPIQKHHHPQPETKQPQPETKKPQKKDKKRKKRKATKQAERSDSPSHPQQKKPKPEIQKQPIKHEELEQPANKQSKKPKEQSQPSSHSPGKDKKKRNSKKEKKSKRQPASKPEKDAPPAKHHQKEQDREERHEATPTHLDYDSHEQTHRHDEPQKIEFKQEQEVDSVPDHHSFHHQAQEEQQQNLDQLQLKGIESDDRLLSWPEHSDYSYQNKYLRQRPEAPHYQEHQEPQQHLEPVVLFQKEAEKQLNQGEQQLPPVPRYEYKTQKHHSPMHDDVDHQMLGDGSIYDEQALQLDKKTEWERGLVSDHEDVSSGQGRTGYNSRHRVDRDRHQSRYERPHERTRRDMDYLNYYDDRDYYDDDYKYRGRNYRYADSDREYKRGRSHRRQSRHRYDYIDPYYDDQDLWQEETRQFDWPSPPTKYPSRQNYRSEERHDQSKPVEDQQSQDQHATTLPWHSSDRSISSRDRSDEHQYYRDTKMYEPTHLARDQERHKTERAKRSRHDELDLFKKSFEYEDALYEDKYRTQHQKAESHPATRRYQSEDEYYGRSRRRHPHYNDDDVYRYYPEEAPKRAHRRRHSYSDDDRYYYESSQPQHSRRRPRSDQKQGHKHAQKQSKRQTPEIAPAVERQPQQPAQQFVIPSVHKSEDSSSEEQSSKRQHTKDIIPIMRRHGEPLMVLPVGQPGIEKGEHGHWLDEPHIEHDHTPSSEDSEERFFEAEASHYPTNYETDQPAVGLEWPKHRRHGQLQNLQAQDQEANDLAHAVIETFSQFMQPLPEGENEFNKDQAENNVQSDEHAIIQEPAVLKMLQTTTPIVNELDHTKYRSINEGYMRDRDDREDKYAHSSSSASSSYSGSSHYEDSLTSSYYDSKPKTNTKRRTQQRSPHQQRDLWQHTQRPRRQYDEETESVQEESDEIGYSEDYEDEMYVDESFNSEEIMDQFDLAMEMLRHHSHGFRNNDSLAVDAVQKDKDQAFKQKQSQNEKPSISFDKESYHQNQDYTKRNDVQLEDQAIDYYKEPFALHHDYFNEKEFSPMLARIYELNSQPNTRINTLLPNSPYENNKKKATHPAPPASHPRSKDMKEEMDYLAHQRQLKDRKMRQKKQHDHPLPKAKIPPVPPQVPLKDKVDPITGAPLEEFDMMAYMLKQRRAKEKEMLKKEQKDPNYKPLSPTAHTPPSVPRKDKKKLYDAEKKQRKQKGRDDQKAPDDKLLKEQSLFDQINKEKMLREKQKRQADPSYKPLSPTSKPKKPHGPALPDQKEDTVFEQMKRKRQEHEQILRDEDAQRAAEDPNYKPKFKLPQDQKQDDTPDTGYEIKKRLADERRKHRQVAEEQFEDDLYSDDLYSDDFDYDSELEDDYYSYSDEDEFGYDDYGDYDDSGYEYDTLDKKHDAYNKNLDYYYDDKGFAHPVKPKDKFGYDRYSDAYNLHYNPQKNDDTDRQQRHSAYSDDEEYSSDYSSSEISTDSVSSDSQFDEAQYYDPYGRYGDPISSTKSRHNQFDKQQRQRRNQSLYHGSDNHKLSKSKPHYTRQNHLNQTPVLALHAKDKEEIHSQTTFKLMMNLETAAMIQKADDDQEADQSTTAAASKLQQDEEEEMDELLQEVEKELHTRFKNIFEGDMLLPNLDFNPAFEGKPDSNLLSLEVAKEKGDSDDYLLSMAAAQDDRQAANWLSPRRSAWFSRRNDYAHELSDHSGYGGWQPSNEGNFQYDSYFLQ